MGLQLIGVILFLVGIVMLFFVPIGTVIGLIVMIVAARMGYKQHKVWKCDACGHYINRD